MDRCFSCGKDLYFFCGDDHIFKSYNENMYCDCCLNKIKNEPRYKITIDTFDGSSFMITVSPKTATFKSCFRQVAKKFKKERIAANTHSLMLHGSNMTYMIVRQESNAFVNDLRNNDKLYLIRNDQVELKINTLGGKSLEINEVIGNSVCSVNFAFERNIRFRKVYKYCVWATSN